MNRTVHVELGERSYDIAIGTDLPVGTAVSAKGKTKGLLVSDSNVDPLHGDACAARLAESGIDVDRAVIPAGESSKSQEQVTTLQGKAFECNLDRSSAIVALGGGMVGDLAGYVAATFMRGICLVQVPTSLLAMVDSSVGGKTAINVPQGKNLVGAFHQPCEVVADLSALDTLPEREYLSGLAEVVKYGVIVDAAFLDLLESNTDGLLARDADLLVEVVARCCEIKADVVAKDEREGGLREILNFGHTLAHALEQVLGYGEMLHGEAVAVGMAYAAAVSVKDCGLPAADGERINALLTKLRLPVSISRETDWEAVRAAMSSDKKSRGSGLRFVLAKAMGSVLIGCEPPEEVLAETFRETVCRV